MKLMQDSMDDGREHYAHDSYEHQTTKKRIARREQLHASALERIDGTHASQNH